jgi:hypothetical protein
VTADRVADQDRTARAAAPAGTVAAVPLTPRAATTAEAVAAVSDPLSGKTFTMRTFKVHRDKDITGASGTGEVAEVCVYSTGWVTMCWLERNDKVVSVEVFTSLDHWVTVHGHDGATRLVPVATTVPS